MTVIRPNSISGINSITAKTAEALAFYEADGTTGNVIAGVVTATNLVSNVTGNVTGNLSGDILGTRTLGTGVTVTAAGIVSATQYYGSAEKLTSIPGDKITAGIPGANITGTIPEASLTNVDLSGLKKDISTLALQVAADTNRAAYNLSNSFVDQYETDVGIAASTNVLRSVAGEYLSTISTVATSFTFSQAGTHGQPEMWTHNQWQDVNTSASGWTNDSGRVNNDTSRKGMFMPKFAFDLAYDFTAYMWMYRDASNNYIHNGGNQTIGGIFLTDTTASAGKNPAVGGTSIFRPAKHSSTDYSARDMDPNKLDDHIFTSAYSTSANVTSVTEHNSTNTGNVTYNIAGNNAAGTLISKLWSTAWDGSNSDNNANGVKAAYTRSNSTMYMSFLNASTGTANGSATITVTGIPTQGRFFLLGGQNSTSATTRSMSLRNNGGDSSTGTVGALTANATGICTSKQNTVTGARTKVSGVLLYRNTSGTANLGTDLKVSFTCNGGTNWTQVGTYTTGSNFSAGVNTIYLGETTCTSGTDVRYQLEWANQADGSKVTEVHGMALNY